MIKELINEIFEDKIPLSQALTKAKVIAYKIKNTDLKNWLNQEITGYETKDLPPYRKIHCDTFAEVRNYMGTVKTIPCDMSEVIDLEETEYSFNEMRITQDIRTIEFGLSQHNGQTYGYEYFPDHLTNQLQIVEGAAVSRIKRRVQYSQLRYVLEITKQKLLDTLLELNDTFPNLENDFTMNKENNEKINQIVNTYVNGNNNPVNVATGFNAEINSTVYNFSPSDERKLLDLGVENKEIKELKDIVENKEDKEDSKKSKVMKWLGTVSASIASRGLYENIPQLTEYVHNLIN